jgi:hypothetical protein
MSGDRVARAWRLVGEQARGAPLSVAHVCAAAAQYVGVDGAGLTVMASPSVREMVHCTDRIATSLEEFQLAFGQGPCMDALGGAPVLAADLRSKDCQTRWPVFAPAALNVGAEAIFALPLQVGAIRLGAVDLYRARPGALSQTELADALAFTDTAVMILLDSTARDQTAAGHRDVAAPVWQGTAMADDQAAVHQAAGMISVQLHVPVGVALTRLRAYAFANDRRLGEVARDVVERRLRFHPDPAPGDQA